MVAQLAGSPTIALFPRQMRFVRDPARFPGYCGGIGSGKSYAGAAKVIARTNRKETGAIYAPTYPMLRDATKRALISMMDDLGIAYAHHVSDNVITVLGSGHEILCRSMDNPDSLRGPNLDYAWVDEASLITREAWNVVKGRVRVGVAPQVWATFTPKGRNFLWEEFERDADPDHPLYRVRTDENPELPPGFAHSLGYAGRFAEQELGGAFVAFEGVVYPGFDRNVHVRRVECGDWPAVLGLDLGTRNPTCILEARYSGDRIHFASELYRRGMGSDDIADEAERWYRATKAQWIVVDPSAAGLIVTLKRRGLRVRKAENDVIVGIGRVTSALADITVDPSCVNTIAEWESYAYKDGGKEEKDAPLKANDHAMDVTRYLVMELVVPKKVARLR